MAGSAEHGSAAGLRNPVDRAIWILETALNEVLLTLERMADEEKWTPARRQEKIKEVSGPVETLIRSVRAPRRDTVVAAWATQVRTLADEVVEVPGM